MSLTTTLLDRTLPGAQRLAKRLPEATPGRARLRDTLQELAALRVKGASWREYVERLEPALLRFDAARPFTEKARLFREAVTLVEFEPHAYCNRQCPFCPNVDHDRLTVKTPFDFATFERALDDLAAAGYENRVRFARYSEPLACPDIVRFVSETRKRLPKAVIDIVSNGDYLNAKLLAELSEAGLNILHISIYPKAYAWNLDEAQSQLDKLLKRTKLMAEPRGSNATRMDWHLPHETVHINAEAVDFDTVGFDRAGTVDHLVDKAFQRQSPCPMVFQNVTVDFDGTVMPCCNLRSDIEEHRPYVVGNLSHMSIIDAFLSEPMTAWRQSLVGVGPKRKPCDSCKQKCLMSGLANAVLGRQIAAKLNSVP
ncbi:MAG: radical SAM protein [Rhodospirillales bacterium]